MRAFDEPAQRRTHAFSPAVGRHAVPNSSSGSARQHDVDDEDLLHALRGPLRIIDQGDRDPSRVLVVGVDRAGRLLEVVVLRPDTTPLVIHGMLLRPSLHRLLDDRR